MKWITSKLMQYLGATSTRKSSITIAEEEASVSEVKEEKVRKKRGCRKRMKDKATERKQDEKELSVISEIESEAGKKVEYKVSQKSKRKCRKKNAKVENKKLMNDLLPSPVNSIGENLPLQEYFGIKYKLVKTEHFEKYLKEMGMNIFQRKVGKKFVPNVFTLDYTGNEYSLLSSSLFLKIDVKFSLDVPFELVTPDGRVCTVCFSFHVPNILVEVQTGHQLHVITRVFKLNSLHMSIKLNNVECKMTFLPSKSFPEGLTPIHANSCRPTIFN